MWKQSKAVRIWNILYPICIYFAVTTITLYILDFILPETMDSKLFRQLITSVVVIPFLYSFYRQDESMRGRQLPLSSIKQRMESPVTIIGMFFFGGCFALAFNNVLGMIRITDHSVSYQQVAETFYTGRIVLEFVSLCIVIPIAEEMLYRGIVYKRAKDWLGMRNAMVISALIFGAVHMNLAQFVYASVFGLILAYFAEVTDHLLGAVVSHMAANLTSVLRAETKVFDLMDQNRMIFVIGTLVLAALAAADIFWLLKRRRKGNVRSD